MAPPSATLAYFASRNEPTERDIVLDPYQSYAAIRVRRTDGTMAWVIARVPVTPRESWVEIMFIAGIDCSSAQFLIDCGAEHIDDRSDSTGR